MERGKTRKLRRTRTVKHSTKFFISLAEIRLGISSNRALYSSYASSPLCSFEPPLRPPYAFHSAFRPNHQKLPNFDFAFVSLLLPINSSSLYSCSSSPLHRPPPASRPPSFFLQQLANSEPKNPIYLSIFSLPQRSSGGDHTSILSYLPTFLPFSVSRLVQQQSYVRITHSVFYIVML